MDMELHRLLWAHVDSDARSAMLWETAKGVFGAPGEAPDLG
jgi:hypothetical protein